MRKQIKLTAIFAAAALLAAGYSITASAGWQEREDGRWQYYDREGEPVTDGWRKEGLKWYYLDEDGCMMTDAWIDDESYVDEDGVMVVNGWRKLTPDDGSEPEEYWYYFGSNGKKTGNGEAVNKKIDGQYYYFDEEGRMQDGWYQDEKGNLYYLGGEDEGFRASGWLKLENWEDDEELAAGDCDIGCDAEGWYYFSPANGRMTRAVKRKAINGRYYYFNEHGQMLYEWIDAKAATPAEDFAATASEPRDITDMRYANTAEEGWEGGGWLEIEGARALDDDKDTNWYYFKNGKAETADPAVAYVRGGSLDGSINGLSDTVRARIKIDGRYFCFNEDGQMQTGLQKISYGANDKFYYFDENGCMKTGKVKDVEEDDGRTYTYYFETGKSGKGEGISGAKGGYLYWNGKRLEADSSYKIYRVNFGCYIVDSKGKIQKNSSKTYELENDNTLPDGELRGSRDGSTGTYKLRFDKDGAVRIGEPPDVNVVFTDGTIELDLPEIVLYERSRTDPTKVIWTMSDDLQDRKTYIK